MSKATRDFTRAVYTFDAVVKRVPSDAWDTPSTCEGWSVRQVLLHQCGVLNALAKIVRTAQMAGPKPAEDEGDPLAQWIACRDNVLEAIEEPGVLEVSGKWWFGEMTIEELVGFVKWDPLTHAWDIGTSVGVDAHMPTDLAADCLEAVKGIEGFARKHGLIGDAVDVPDGAPATDQFLAFIGRQP